MRRLCAGLLILSLLLGTGCAQKTDSPEETPETLPTVTEQTLPTETAEPTTVPVETQPEKTTIDTVPLYYQTDYPFLEFGYGTMATSGCSMACLAMIATYMTDNVYMPDQMAVYFEEHGKNHVERLDYGIAQMQLPYQRSHNVREVLAGLREGKVAIAMMDAASDFTDEQHFIVLAGINEAGKIVIHDPYEPNYTRATVHLKDAYDNGFEDYHVIKGFSGAWIFDKKDMPEEPFLFDAPMPEQRETRYTGYTLPEEEFLMLAQFVSVEAKGESQETKQAVAEVVLNRMISPDYPYPMRKVISQTEMHRALKAMAYVKEPDSETCAAVEAAMYGPYILPENVCFYSAWEEGEDLWGQLGSYRFYAAR